MKKFLIFTFLLFIFLFKKDFIFSQEISPTPEPGSLGGKCKTEGLDINEINFPKISGTDDAGGKWGCIGFTFLKLNLFCISDIILKAKESVKEFISIDELTQVFQELNICDPGLEPSTLDVNNEDCICIDPDTKNLSKLSDRLCQNLNSNKREEIIRCNDCFYNGGYYSALGCIYFSDWKTFFEKNIFGLLIGLAGFIALICIIYSAFQLQLSQGNAEKIRKSQELLTSCILGLMLIIFSVFILKVIGVDILRIPGFK